MAGRERPARAPRGAGGLGLGPRHDSSSEAGTGLRRAAVGGTELTQADAAVALAPSVSHWDGENRAASAHAGHMDVVYHVGNGIPAHGLCLTKAQGAQYAPYPFVVRAEGRPHIVIAPVSLAQAAPVPPPCGGNYVRRGLHVPELDRVPTARGSGNEHVRASLAAIAGRCQGVTYALGGFLHVSGRRCSSEDAIDYVLNCELGLIAAECPRPSGDEARRRRLVRLRPLSPGVISDVVVSVGLP